MEARQARRLDSSYSCQSAERVASGVQGAATRVLPSWADGTSPGKILSPSSRSVPQTKQVGNGWEPKPGYDALAVLASVQVTASTGSISCSTYDASATTAPPNPRLTPSSVGVSCMLASRGGGCRSTTATARPKLSPISCASEPET